jgi:peptidyl-prolyl isomerase E (cyclophilin E)
MSILNTDNRHRVIYVGGLAEEMTEEILKAAFIPFGDIVDVMIPMNYEHNKNRGFGFVEFELREDAMAAQENMHNGELFGKVLSVNLARARSLEKNKAVWEANPDQYFKVDEKYSTE